MKNIVKISLIAFLALLFIFIDSKSNKSVFSKNRDSKIFNYYDSNRILAGRKPDTEISQKEYLIGKALPLSLVSYDPLGNIESIIPGQKIKFKSAEKCAEWLAQNIFGYSPNDDLSFRVSAESRDGRIFRLDAYLSDLRIFPFSLKLVFNQEELLLIIGSLPEMDLTSFSNKASKNPLTLIQNSIFFDCEPVLEPEMIIFPSGKTPKLAWLIYAENKNKDKAYGIVIDASNEEVLWYASLISDFQQDNVPSALVFSDGSPQPFSIPGENLPPIVERDRVLLTGENLEASPLGWVISSTPQKLSGNNITSFDGRNSEINRYILSNPDGNFEYKLQLGVGSPQITNYVEATAANSFYFGNKIHDFLYSLGFTETSGNCQLNNFNRGGLSEDPVNIYTQYGNGRNNATATVWPDGKSPELRMYLWDLHQYSPLIACDLESNIVYHEYTHCMSRRIIPILSYHSSLALNECWSDFYALVLDTPIEFSPESPLSVGAYSSQNSVGIRTHPYSTNSTVNPLTFKNYPLYYYHYSGEIFCNMLVNIRAQMMHKYGNRAGNQKIAQLVFYAMEITGSNPTFVEFRDNIFKADQIYYNGEDLDLLWGVFVNKFLGFLAYAPKDFDYIKIVSNESPSPRGAIGTTAESYKVFYYMVVDVGDLNNNKNQDVVEIESAQTGEKEEINLTRSGFVLASSSIYLTNQATTSGDLKIWVKPGDTIKISYFDENSGDGTPILIQKKVSVADK